jgi:amidohydrolase
MTSFLDEAKKILPLMIEIRRDLHRNPELGMQEVRTSQMVADHLKSLGLEVKSGVGGTGVVGTLHAKPGGATIAIRADMDALPMEDKKNVPYASTRAGVAHSCGHDGHTAILLGAANLFSKISDSLRGNVKFIFQPCEDTIPGGALPMIRDGALENPATDGIFSLHLQPSIQEGSIRVKAGYSTISSAGFVLRMMGKGGHVSRPHEIADPIMMAGLVIVNGQTIVSRRVDPLDPTLVTFSTVHGGTANNIIPDEAILTGTIRTLKPEAREELAKRLGEVARGAAETLGGTYDLKIDMEYPSVFNHPDMVTEFMMSAARVVGEDGVTYGVKPSMGGEDVSYFHQRVPGVNWELGVRNPELGMIHPLHSSLFDFHEEVMAMGAAVHVQAAIDFLTNRESVALTFPFPGM